MDHLLAFVTHHWYFVVPFIVVMILIFIEEAKSQGVAGGVATAAAATKLLNEDKAVVLDIREADAFKAGHIIQAINIPSKTLDSSFARLEKYKEKTLIIACERGQSAVGIASKLRKKGFGSVLVLKGGMTAWKKDSMPVVK